MKLITLPVLMLLAVCSASGQNEPLMRLFPLQNTWHNPAFTSHYEGNELMLSHREQWTGFDGSPVTSIMSFTHYFDKLNSGLGVVAMHDKIGIFDTWETGLSYSYKIKLKNDIKIGIGFQFTVINRGLNNDWIFNDLVSYDPAVYLGEKSRTVPNLNTGINVSWKELTVGYSVKHLTEFQFDEINPNYTFNWYHNLSGMYNWELSEKFSLQPAVMYHNDKKRDLLDFYLTGLLFQKVYAGMGYMNSDLNNYNIIAGYRFGNTVKLMVGYGPATPQYSETQSFELALNVNF